MIRQPIIVVMGHVDHGKTSLLDKIRSTTVANKEAGGITQHIGASEVPIEVINKVCGPMLKSASVKINLPGLLFIDTPGHEAFTNLRKRGGSVADIAILVVDISKGFEPQTIEAIEILKSYKTPFVVAANKVDLITGWITRQTTSISESLSKQNAGVREELDRNMYELMGRLSESGFGSDIFNRVKDFRKEIAIVPLSAKTGEGIAELLMVVTGLAQRFLEEELKTEVNGPAKGSILEKKEVKGLGITLDVILYDGTIHVNDTIAFATEKGVSTAKVKALLKPKPLQEIRESSAKFYSVQEVSAASGVKISGNGLEEAMPGSPIVGVAGAGYESEISRDIGDLFSTDKAGVILKADSIGSIEAISRLMKAEGLGISKKGIGNITKRDIMDAFTMIATDPLNAVVMGFNVKVDQDAEEIAQSSGIKILTGEIIYKLLDDYKLFLDERKRKINAKAEDTIVFPGEIRILRNSCFRVSNPAVFGVEVLFGRVRQGYYLMNDAGAVIGKIKEVQKDRSSVAVAKKGDQVAISVDGPTFGRQIWEELKLYTRVGDADARLLEGEFKNLIDAEEASLLKKILGISKQARFKAGKQP